MIAFRATNDRNMLRPSISPRLHGAAPSTSELSYAPALSFPKHATAQSVIDALRLMRPGNETVYYLFVTGEEDRLEGVVSLRQVVIARPETRLEAIMSREVISLPVGMPPEEQAHVLGMSGFVALPVVDGEGRLLGSLDAAELLKAVQDGATGDMFRLAGVSRDEELARPLPFAIRDRLAWLLLMLGAASLAVTLVAGFQGLLAQTTLLAASLPLLAVMGTAAATQTLTFVVRGLNLGEVNVRNARIALRREMLIGLCNGLCLGLITGLLAWLWQGSLALSLVLGVALLVSLLVASFAGVLVPLAFKALRIDPALVSSIIVTTVVGLCGLACLLALGSMAVEFGFL